MESKVVKELNGVLKGEQMAVDIYENYIKSIEDEKVKKEFIEIRNDHKQHVGQLEQRISQLGGEPESGTGIGGFMANAKTLWEAKTNDTLDILKKAYEGENKGLAMVEEIVKGDLDEDSEKLIKDMRNVDKRHLKSMGEMIEDFENKH